MAGRISLQSPCEIKLQEYDQVMQGPDAICWFVSIVNAMLLSDGLSSILSKHNVTSDSISSFCKIPKNLVSHLQGLSEQPCSRMPVSNQISQASHVSHVSQALNLSDTDLLI